MFLWTSLALGAPSIAIADLDNHTGDARLDAAGPGTASILVTRLAAVPDLTIVERTRLQAVLSEIELSSGGAVDDATRVEAGRIIGADVRALLDQQIDQAGPVKAPAVAQQEALPFRR